ncbi:MAG: FHA domain-containing protein, partial [Chloroflexia bacterium]|nr:FHA domain-containing protein [Chloroflexia bacterium]
VYQQGGQWIIEDLDSTNKTRVNGQPLAPHTPMALTDGVRLDFGRVSVTFKLS